MSGLTYLVLIVVAIVHAACGPSGPRDVELSRATPAGAGEQSPLLRTVAERECEITVPADVEIDDVTVRTDDGVPLRAAVLGTGARGVVMLHQTIFDVDARVALSPAQMRQLYGRVFGTLGLIRSILRGRPDSSGTLQNRR